MAGKEARVESREKTKGKTVWVNSTNTVDLQANVHENKKFYNKSNFRECVSKIDKTTEMRLINLRTNILINTSAQQNLSCFLKIFVHH